MEKQTYIAPKVEVIEIKTEKGFAGSYTTDDLPSFEDGGW